PAAPLKHVIEEFGPACPLAQDYLVTIEHANVAFAAFERSVQSLRPSAPAASMAQLAGPAASAMEQADSALNRIPSPPDVRTYIGDLVNADAALIGDLKAAITLSIPNRSTWILQLSVDGARVTAAANTYRSWL